MRIVQVVPRVTNEASGPSYSVVELCRALRALDIDSTLAVLNSGPVSQSAEFIEGFPHAGFPNRLGRSAAMKNWLRCQARGGKLDLIHNHSLWMMPNVYCGWATSGTTVPLVVSPRGTFSKWALNRSRLVKRFFWATMQARAINHAACFHATAESEYLDIRRAGFKQPISIIPNGIDLPTRAPTAPRGRRKLLFLGRIHPVKGIENLLRAWHLVAQKCPDWEIQVVGPDNEGYLEKMKALASQLFLPRVYFTGPLFGAEKVRAYMDADLYVLPTYSENFGMTVAESLAAGTPAIVTKGAPWAGLNTKGAGWWIDIGVEPLVACLEEALACSPERLATMGEMGRKWMADEFSWKRVGDMMLETYQWILGNGEQPAFVITD